MTMFRALTLALFVTVFLGCGQSGDNFKGDRGEVSGKITVKGAPAPKGCSVVFQSKDGPNYSAVGTVGDNGEYSLMYNGKKSLPAVMYIATVIPPTDSAPQQMTTEQMTTTAADIGKSAKSRAKPKNAFSPAFSSALTSGLEFPVKKGPNTADFDLTP